MPRDFIYHMWPSLHACGQVLHYLSFFQGLVFTLIFLIKQLTRHHLSNNTHKMYLDLYYIHQSGNFILLTGIKILANNYALVHLKYRATIQK